MRWIQRNIPDSKVLGVNMGPTWDLSAPGGSYVGPTNLAIWNIIAENILEQLQHLIGFIAVTLIQFID